MKYKEQEELVRDLRALADFFETKEALALPLPEVKISTWVDGGREDQEVSILKTIAKVLPGKTEKKVDDFSYTLINASIAPSIPVEYWCGRTAVCTARVVGREVVPVTKTVNTGEFREREIIEWDCPPSLLGN